MYMQTLLTHLHKSADNVRKTQASKASHTELKASIVANGLLQNLVVQPHPDLPDNYEVIAGNRRLTCLKELQAEGHLAEDHTITCFLAESSDPVEASLAENIIREAMHPADMYEAIAKLVEEGATASQIATRFGMEEALIRRRLKLGKVAPEILDAFREDKINLERVMALTLTDDHEQQVAIFNRYLEHPHSYPPHAIRSKITEGSVSSNSRLGKFVGAEAVREADGEITCDLFSNDGQVYFEDPELLFKLAEEKLASHAKDLEAEGWKWAKPALGMESADLNTYGRLHPEAIGVPDEVTTELKQVEARLTELEDLYDDWTDENEEEENTLLSRKRELNSIVQDHMGFTSEAKAKSGCIVTVGYSGDITLHAGLIDPEDIEVEEDTDISDNDQPEADTDGDTEPEQKGFSISQVLGEDLAAHRLQIVKSYLVSDFDLAFDLMLYSLCTDTLKGIGYHRKPLDIHFQATPENSSREDLEDTSADNRRSKIFQSFDLSWLNEPEDKAFQALCAKSKAEKQALFAYVVALGLNGGLNHDGKGNPILEAVGKRLNIDVAKDWRPTADNFWGRITKTHSLALSSQVLGAEWALAHSKDKKSVIAARLENIYSGSNAASFPASVREQAIEWVPDFMQYGDGETIDLTEASIEDHSEEALQENPEPNTTVPEDVDEDMAPMGETVNADLPPVAASEQDEPIQPSGDRPAFDMQDRIQILHVGPDKPTNAEDSDEETPHINNVAVTTDVTEEVLPDFLREMAS